MARVNPRKARAYGRSSVFAFWKHYAVACLLLVLGVAQLPAGSPLTGIAPWLLAAAALVLLKVAASLALGTRWWVTDNQVVQSSGVVSRHTEELPLCELSEIRVEQGPIAGLLDIGTVALVWGERRRLLLRGVRSPRELERLLSEARKPAEDKPEH